MKEFFGEAISKNPSPGMKDSHWFDLRKELFSQARQKWNDSSEDFKTEMRRRAQALNMYHKNEYESKKDKHDQVQQDLQISESALVTKQRTLLKAALDSKLVFDMTPLNDPAPSLARPQALADHASKRNLDPLPPLQNGHVNQADHQLAEDSCASSVGMNSGLGRLCRNPKYQECVLDLCEHGHGLHGVGDAKYGVSESLMSYMVENVEGFVKNCHNQFTANHGHVCAKTSEDFSTSLQNDECVDTPNTCEHLCGKYCIRQIKDRQMFANAIELVKSIARAMSKKRCVKVGNQMHLSPSPETYFPVLLIQTSDPQVKYARLACRIAFNPLEVDFVHCSVTKQDDAFKLNLQLQELPHSDRLSLAIDRSNEFAAWFSMSYDPSWKCTLYMEYDIVVQPLHLMLRPCHAVSAATSRDGRSFEIPEVSAKPAETDTASAMSYVNQLLKGFNIVSTGQSNKRKLGTNQKSAKRQRTEKPIKNDGQNRFLY